MGDDTQGERPAPGGPGGRGAAPADRGAGHPSAAGVPDPIETPASPRRPSPLQRVLGAVRELGAVGPLAAFAVLGPLGGALVLVATAGVWFPPLEAQGPLAALWLFLATGVLAGLSLVPTHATSLVAGMLFGAGWGSVLALAGIGGAALLGYAVLRRLVGERAIEALARRPRAAAVHRALLERGGHHVAGLLALIRLSPVMPFAGTNLLMAASGVGVGAFLGGTLAGIAPRVVAVAVAGAGLEELDLSRGADRRLAVVGLVATAAALALMGGIARRALARAARPANACDPR